jgi:hypothetical protein
MPLLASCKAHSGRRARVQVGFVGSLEAPPENAVPRHSPTLLIWNPAPRLAFNQLRDVDHEDVIICGDDSRPWPTTSRQMNRAVYKAEYQASPQ